MRYNVRRKECVRLLSCENRVGLRGRAMADRRAIRLQAEQLSVAKRKSVLRSFREIQFHRQLESLFTAMDPDLKVAVVHGRDEFGKDLVVVRDDAFGTTANAVVVKKGDVTAKSAGPIADIKDQVAMAISHPAELPHRVARVPISEVWVVILGNISGNARERLEREYKGTALKFFDLDRLVDDFTEHFPEVYFGGQTMDYMLETIEELEAAHLFASKNLSLSECFVGPYVVKSRVAVDDCGDALPIVLRERKLPFQRFGEVGLSEKRVVLVGDAGGGKSTALRKLAIDGLREAVEELKSDAGIGTATVPLFCTARDFASCGTADDFDQNVVATAALPENLHVGALLVDGLDEVPVEERIRVLELAKSIADDRDYNVVVSSRRIDLLREPLEEWITYELMPLEFGQAMGLFERIIDSSQTLGVLKEGLEHVSGSLDLTPMSLLLLLELAERYHEIPASVTELYDRYADQVLGKYDREKGIEVLFEYEMKKRFLGEMAYKELVCKNRLDMPYADFATFGAQYFMAYDWDSESWDPLVHELERACILRVDPSGLVQFRHRSFAEFFSAYYLGLETGDIEDVNVRATDLYFDPVWSDVAFYFFGLRKALSADILSSIFDRDDTTPMGLMSKFGVGRLLQAAWHSKADVKREGLDRASRYAVPVRKDFMDWASKSKKPIPPIVGDFMLLSMSMSSFRSAFLRSQTAALLGREIPPTEDELIPALCLFAGLERSLDSAEREALLDKFLVLLGRVSDKSLEARGLVYLLVLTDEDGGARKAVQSRWKRFSGKYRAVCRGILPPQPARADHKRKRD